jgi:hypothetical protein
LRKHQNEKNVQILIKTKKFEIENEKKLFDKFRLYRFVNGEKIMSVLNGHI